MAQSPRGVRTEHVHDAGPVPPGDLRADRGAPGGTRPLLPRDRHPPDRRDAVAGPCTGAWPKPLEEAEVRQLLDGLYDLKIAAEAWRSDLFPELSPARTVHRAACLAEGFRTEGLRGEPTHWVPWDRIELICAGRIAAEDEFRNVQSPRWPSTIVAGFRALALMKPRFPSRRARATRIPRDPGRRGDHRPPRAADRLPRRREPDELRLPWRTPEPVGRRQFPGVRRRPLRRADAAYITPSTRSLLEGRDAGDCEFPSSQALLDYATHRLLWSWYRRDRDAQEGWGTAQEPEPDDDRADRRRRGHRRIRHDLTGMHEFIRRRGLLPNRGLSC